MFQQHKRRTSHIQPKYPEVSTVAKAQGGGLLRFMMMQLAHCQRVVEEPRFIEAMYK